MAENFLKKVSVNLNHLHWLIQPIIAAMVAISAKFWGYNFSENFIQLHPIQYAISAWFVAKTPWIFGFSVIALMLVSINELESKASNKVLARSLLEEKEKNIIIGENIQRLVDGYLYQLGRKLNFGISTSAANDNCERITIYIHDKNDKFIPFGRYSTNPQYRGPGRTFYPDNEGCISLGWQNGWHFENNLGIGSAYKRNTRNRYSIDDVTLQKIKMRSRLFAVKRIEGKDGHPLAVIVVESLNNQRFTESAIRKSMEQENEFLSGLITTLWDHIPKPTTARSRGF